MGNFTHDEDFTFIVNRMCFDEHDAKVSGARAVEIYQAGLFRPYKGRVPR